MSHPNENQNTNQQTIYPEKYKRSDWPVGILKTVALTACLAQFARSIRHERIPE